MLQRLDLRTACTFHLGIRNSRVSALIHHTPGSSLYPISNGERDWCSLVAACPGPRAGIHAAVAGHVGLDLRATVCGSQESNDGVSHLASAQPHPC